MSPVWDDVNARVHGLAGHLLDPDELDQLAHASSLGALAVSLRQHGVMVAESALPPGAFDLELAIRRWAANALAILARWAGPRSAALPFVFADEDRRSIRALLRGAVQRAPAPERLAGLIPTPDLPERALEELAASPTVARVVAHLVVWRHPLAPMLLDPASTANPDLLAIEAALGRAAAGHALQAASRAGDRRVRRFVIESIDLDNAVTALALAQEATDVRPRDLFVPGGDRVTIVAFEEAVVTGNTAAAAKRLATALADAPCAELLGPVIGSLAGLEDELLRCRLRHLTRTTRIDPLGALTVIRFALQLRLQVRELCRVVWSVALDASPATAEAGASA